jgi:hypothetical protein
LLRRPVTSRRAPSRPFPGHPRAYIDTMADKRSATGLGMILAGAALLAVLSTIQVGIGWPRVDAVVKKGMLQYPSYPE